MLEIDTSLSHIQTFTLSRPDVHNALTPTLIEALTDGFAKAGTSDSLRAIVLRGKGASFCAGADLIWMKNSLDSSPHVVMEDARALYDMLAAIATCPVPVITLAHGSVYGGGLGLLAASDIVLATQTCTFCLSEVKLGLAPAVIAPWVTRKIGSSWFLRHALTAQPFSTALAHKMGLVHDVVADEPALDALLTQLLKYVIQVSPQAVRACKDWAQRLSHNVLSQSEEQDEAAALITRLRRSAEGQEGMRAFLEKRTPIWSATGQS